MPRKIALFLSGDCVDHNCYAGYLTLKEFLDGYKDAFTEEELALVPEDAEYVHIERGAGVDGHSRIGCWGEKPILDPADYFRCEGKSIAVNGLTNYVLNTLVDEDED